MADRSDLPLQAIQTLGELPGVVVQHVDPIAKLTEVLTRRDALSRDNFTEHIFHAAAQVGNHPVAEGRGDVATKNIHEFSP